MAAEFKDKFIAYIDILGFTKLVEASEAGTGLSLDAIIELVSYLGTARSRDRYVKSGPRICPAAGRVTRDLDFRITQVSDCAVVSTEISPAGVINLIGHCWEAVLELLMNGIMCRGYITRGSIYHDETHLIGPGYNRASSMEKHGVSAFKNSADERGTPFVEIDQIVCEFVRECEGDCVKKMFERQVEFDGSVTVLFPFKRISHGFIVSPRQTFDPEKEKRSVRNVRAILINAKGKVDQFVDRTNPSAVTKAQHYIAALDRQLEVCDRTDRIIDRLAGPFPRP